MLLHVSSEAEEYIKSIMQRYSAPLGLYITLKVTGCSGLSVQPEVVCSEPADSEPVVVTNDLTIFVEHKYAKLLDATSITLEHKSLGQKQLKFISPHAEAECGCGESFTIPEDVMQQLVEKGDSNE